MNITSKNPIHKGKDIKEDKRAYLSSNNSSNISKRKKRKVAIATTNPKPSIYIADSSFICHILDNVRDISETMLVAILQFTIRHLSDYESFTKVMKSLLRAPFNGLFMSRSLRELTNPEVKVVLLYLRRALKFELLGGNQENGNNNSNSDDELSVDGDASVDTSISREDKVLPRVVAWC